MLVIRDPDSAAADARLAPRQIRKRVLYAMKTDALAPRCGIQPM